jgi:sulfite dehydrogenase
MGAAMPIHPIRRLETPMNDTLTSPRRRHLLAGSAGALAAAGLGGWSTRASAQQAKALPPYATWKDADSVIVHSANTIETRRHAFGSSGITPTDRLYVRNNLPPPDASIVANPDLWEISIEGVQHPRTLQVGQLKALGLETVTMVLQCSGNGRSYFPHKPSGTQWTVGAAGCVVWSGVPVRAVAEALGGINPGMLYMTGTGGEKLPDGIDPKSVIVERSLPAKAIGDALLAWEMNGAPIPLAHGGPLRLIVPGYTGVNNIKYIKRLAFTPVESDAKIMAGRYRMTPKGEKANSSHASVLEMSVKSWINQPLGDAPIAAGQTQIVGVAFAGTQGVKRVEVSIDGGKTWREARFFGPDLGKFAWRQFALPVHLAPGQYTIVSRATDKAGNVQPETRIENASGYNNNSWADHAVKASVA